jgi:hypothetical protein
MERAASRAGNLQDSSHGSIILFTIYTHEIKETEATVPGITRVVSKNEPHTIVVHRDKLLQVA